MKLVKRDFKHETKLKPENLDDLWNLKNLLQEGDIVGAKTLRTIQATDSGEKRPVYLRMRVEKVSFEEDGNRLRIHGKIVSGPDDIQFGYHSITVNPNDVIAIEKDWRRNEIFALEESLKYRGMKVLICVMDERRADVFLATETKIIPKAAISSKSAGKGYGGDVSPGGFYEEIIEYIKDNSDNVDKIIIAGPGFAKDNMYSTIKDVKLKQKIIIEAASVTGKTGVNEVVKRGGLDRVMKASRISEETKKVENFLVELAKESGLVTYGKAQVRHAIECGAAEEVLVSDRLVRDTDVEHILAAQKQAGGNICIVNSTHEAGEKLLSLGGIAAFLRYKLEFSRPR